MGKKQKNDPESTKPKGLDCSASPPEMDTQGEKTINSSDWEKETDYSVPDISVYEMKEVALDEQIARLKELNEEAQRKIDKFDMYIRIAELIGWTGRFFVAAVLWYVIWLLLQVYTLSSVIAPKVAVLEETTKTIQKDVDGLKDAVWVKSVLTDVTDLKTILFHLMGQLKWKGMISE